MMKANFKASTQVSLFCTEMSHLINHPASSVRVEWTKDSGGRWKMEEVPGSEKFFPAQLVFLALGFLGPQPDAIKALGVKQDARSNIQTPHKKYSTNVPGVFAAGDCRRGQSLIVWGIK